MSITRRDLIGTAGALGVIGILSTPSRAEKRFPVQLSEAAWKRRLSPAAFAVLRHEATERPYTSPLNKEKRRGTYHCAGCNQPLFRSQTKFESGTGWPSFTAPVSADAVACVEEAFLALATKAVAMPPILRLDIPEHRGEVDVKTAYVPGLDGFAIKISPGFFDNPNDRPASLNGVDDPVLPPRPGVVDALLLAAGGRAGAEVVRHGAERAEVSATFAIEKKCRGSRLAQ